MSSIKKVLMERDNLTAEEADAQIKEARETFYQMLEDGEDPSDICEEMFGLEPDYIMDLM